MHKKGWWSQLSIGSSQQPVRVFVSSTWEDLQPEREKVEDALDRLRDSTFSGMEHFGSRPDTPRKASLEEVDRSDIYVGIFAHRYGSGITEAEYDRARELEIPCLIYFKDENVPVLPKHIERGQVKVKKLEALRKKLKDNHICSPFVNPDNLATIVVTDLRNEIPNISAGETGPVQSTTPVPPQPHFAHPYPLQPNFTGRVTERAMLTEWYSTSEQPVLALVAFGGMGKSALAWAWLLRDVLSLPLPGASDDSPEDAEACRVTEDARPEGTFWWSFYERDSTFEGFLDKALAYASGGQIPEGVEGAYEKMEALVNLLRERRLLLVLDGFERLLRQYASMEAVYQEDEEGDVPAHDRACADPNAATFLRRLAGGPFNSHVLLTSRLFPKELEGDGGEAVANCAREDLTNMDPEDAVAFFQAQGIKGNRSEIEAACQPYGYQPLALRLLAGVIVGDSQTPKDIRAAERHGLLNEQKGDKLRRMLKAAYDALDSKKRGLLSRIAAFRSAVDYEAVSLFKTKKNANQFNSTLDELIERGLLLDSEGSRYDMHPLVREYAYRRLKNKKRVHERLVEYFAEIPVPEDEDVKSMEDLAPLIELYHHTVGAGRYQAALELYRDQISMALYFRIGSGQSCIELLRALFPNGEGEPPGLTDEFSQGWTFNALANAYSVSGEPKRSVPLFEQGISLQSRQRTASERENFGIGLCNLAHMALLPLGVLATAEAHLRQSEEVARQYDFQFLEAVDRLELGRLLALQGELDRASGLIKGRYLGL